MSKKVIRIKKKSENVFKDFPYYDELLERSKSVEDNWKSVCPLFIKLDNENLSLLFAIIYHHGLLNNNPVESIPYKGKTNKNGRGIIFNGKDIPDDLKKIIQVYMSDIIE